MKKSFPAKLLSFIAPKLQIRCTLHIGNEAFQNHIKIFNLFMFILSTPQTIQSQTMRKLNPMKSPNTPPTSATRERAG